MEIALLIVAFVCGFLSRFVKLPPLVGYLIAGFVLNLLGFSNNDTINTLAELGITVMLFTIGLKLNVRDLVKREIWLGATSHTVLWVLLSIGFCSLLGVFSLPYFTDIELQTAALIGFAFSFSSTVCVIKILEESGESRTRHGKVAIGILIMQDIFAVLFLVAATGKTPSVYALLLLLFIPLSPLFKRFLLRVGHGELLPLSGFVFALGSYHVFEMVGIKGDLGALIMGILLSGNSKATELSKSLLSFKDLFLIGFFLSIGLRALPNSEMMWAAVALTLLLPIKFLLFYAVLSSLRLRARTGFLTGAVMSNYSEFGLIVTAVAISAGLLTQDWLIIIAIAVSISFVITSVFYRKSHDIYRKLKDNFRPFQRTKPLPEDIYPSFSNIEVVVIGMGRVGKGAFSALSQKLGDKVCGMDADEDRVNALLAKNLNAILGDGESIDLWENIDLSTVKLVLLALPSIEDSSNVTRQLRNAGYSGKIAAIARYEDEIKPLRDKGVDEVFNFFNDAGLGFAEESLEILKQQP